MGVVYSTILAPSLWRVFSITLSSPTDMPSLTTVTLDRDLTFLKKTIHTKSTSSFSPSCLDITPALERYLSEENHFPNLPYFPHFPLSFTTLLIHLFQNNTQFEEKTETTPSLFLLSSSTPHHQNYLCKQLHFLSLPTPVHACNS